jgi:hypothetical protein
MECLSRVHFATFTETHDAMAAYIAGSAIRCAGILRLDTSARSTTRIVRAASKRPDRTNTLSTFGAFPVKGGLQIALGVVGELGAVPGAAALVATPVGLVVAIGGALVCAGIDLVLDATADYEEHVREFTAVLFKARNREMHGDALRVVTSVEGVLELAGQQLKAWPHRYSLRNEIPPRHCRSSDSLMLSSRGASCQGVPRPN